MTPIGAVGGCYVSALGKGKGSNGGVDQTGGKGEGEGDKVGKPKSKSPGRPATRRAWMNDLKARVAEGSLKLTSSFCRQGRKLGSDPNPSTFSALESSPRSLSQI